MLSVSNGRGGVAHGAVVRVEGADPPRVEEASEMVIWEALNRRFQSSRGEICFLEKWQTFFQSLFILSLFVSYNMLNMEQAIKLSHHIISIPLVLVLVSLAIIIVLTNPQRDKEKMEVA